MLVLGKISKIDKPLARRIKKIMERTQINKIGNEKGEEGELQQTLEKCN